MGGKKGKVTRWGQLAARLAANFDFAIVAFAVSPLVKSSLKDFVVSFSFLACTIRCHDLSLSISLAVSFLSRAFSLSCSYAPFPSQADSFSLAHFFPRFFFSFAFSSFSTCQSLVPSRSLLVHQNRFHPPFCLREYLTFVPTAFPLSYLQTRFISGEPEQYIFI